MRNTLANLLAPLTAPEEDRSGGATATSGGKATANGDSTRKLRSGHTSGCLSIYMLPGTYPSDAEERGRLEQCWRRSSAAASMAATRRNQPEQPEGDRVIKLGSTPPTDAASTRNREEKVSPELETKGEAYGRKGGNLELAASWRRQAKMRKG